MINFGWEGSFTFRTGFHSSLSVDSNLSSLKVLSNLGGILITTFQGHSILLFLHADLLKRSKNSLFCI